MKDDKCIAFWQNWYEAITKRNNLNVYEQNFCYALIFEYAFNGTTPEIKNDKIAMWFDGIRPNIDSNLKKREAGKKGGRGHKSDGQKNKNSALKHALKGGLSNKNKNENENENENFHSATSPAHGGQGSGSEDEDGYRMQTEEDATRWMLENGWKLVDGEWHGPNGQME